MKITHKIILSFLLVASLTSLAAIWTQQLLLASATTLVLAIFFGGYFSFLISRNFRKLNEAAQNVGNGNLDTQVEITSNDEIGELSRSFNKMIADLRDSRSDLATAKTLTDKILASMVDFVLVTDMDMTITQVNQAALQLNGYDEHELIGQPVNMLLADRPFNQKGVEILRKNGFAASLDKVIRDKNGKQTPVSMSLSVFKDEDGRDLGIVCVGKDTSKQTRAEAERKVIYEVIQGVTTTSNLDELLGLIHRSIGNVLYAENCYVALVDPATEMLTLPFFVDKRDPKPPSAKLGAGLTAYVFRTGKPKLMTAEVIRELCDAGEMELVGTTPGIWLGVPLRTPRGIIGVLVVQHYEDPDAYDQRDVEFLTSVGDQIALAIERKRSDDAVKENEAKFKDLFDNAPVAYHELDTNGCYVRINHTEELLLGYTNDELRGKHPAEFIVETVSRDATKAKLAGDLPLLPIERTFIRKDGSHISVLNQDILIRDADGEVTGIRSTLQDITSLKHAEEQLKIFNEKLQQSNRELQDFAYVASHDLQEPLRKVQAFSDRLKTKYADKLEGDGLDYLERMRSAASRMQLLIQDLLTFSRVSTKAQPFTPVDLNQITSEVLSDLEVKIEETGAAVDFNELPTLDADPMQMRQLIQNLVGNALKFQQVGTAPVITISSQTVNTNGNLYGPHCQIIVKDNGIGFDEKYTDKIFAVFQRLHGRTEYEGSGVGLAICRKIVERHNGNITAHSAPGEGASFAITIPLKQPEQEAI